MKITSPRIAIAVAAIVVGGCSIIVNADRSKVQDDLFHPQPKPDGGAEEAGTPESDAGGDSTTEGDATGDAGGASDAGEASASEGGASDAGDASVSEGGDAAVGDGSARDAIADAADGG
jgi:hypothetical protein